MSYRAKVLALVCVPTFLVGLDMFIVNVAFPRLETAFGSGDAGGVSWVLNGYTITLAALMVPAGRVADRSGRRLVFLAGLVLFGGASGLAGMSSSLAMLIAARVIQAVGAACLLPTSLALLLPEFSGTERVRAISLWAAAGGVAAAFGPPVGGLLAEADWRWVFYLNVPVVLIGFTFAVRLLHESRQESVRLPDLIGAILLATAVALVVLALVQAPSWRWASAGTIGTLVAGLAAGGAFWIRCRRHPSPVVDPSLLRVRSYALANAAAVAFSASFSTMLLAAVLVMTTAWHDSILVAGLSLAPGPALAAICAVLSGRLFARTRPSLLGAAGTLLFAIGCAWFLWKLTTVPGYAVAMLPGLVLTGIGVGFTLPALTTAAAASLPPERFATGSAVFTMSRQIGFVFGVAVLIGLLEPGRQAPLLAQFQHGWLFAVLSAVIAAVVALAIGDLKHVSAPPASRPQAKILPLQIEEASA